MHALRDADAPTDFSAEGEAVAKVTQALAGMSTRDALRVLAITAISFGHYDEARRMLAMLERLPAPRVSDGADGGSRT